MKNLLTLLINNAEFIFIGLIISVGFFFLFFRNKNTIYKKAKKIKPITHRNFLEQWDTYRKSDTSGCYILFIYRRRPSIRTVHKMKHFTDIYIGQSINMYKRVYNHLTGHGNGDVYADVKYKRFVYIKFIPCKVQDLNNYEKTLINEFNAIDSYNRTKGGSKITHK